MTDGCWYAAHLQPGERVLWQGAPGHRPFWTNENAPMLLMLPLCAAVCGLIGFAVQNIVSAGVRVPLPILLAAAALVLPVAGWLVWLGLLQWVTPWLLLRRTAYVITDKRILRLRGRRIDALDLLHEPEITLRPERDGHGSLLFGRHPMENATSFNKGPSEYHIFRREPFALWHVPEAKQVLGILRGVPGKGKTA